MANEDYNIFDLGYDRNLIKTSDIESNKETVNQVTKGGMLAVGSLDSILRFDGENGLWLGNQKFADAPFSVDLDGNISGGSFSLSSISGDLDDVNDGSTYKRVTINEKTGAGRAYTGLDSSNNLVTAFEPAGNLTPGSQGLYMDSTHMGFHDGNNWISYIDSAGNFYFNGDGSNYIYWNGSSLDIRGTLNADDISAGTITGRTVRTDTAGNSRVQMVGSSDTLKWTTSSNTDSTTCEQYIWPQGTGFKISHWNDAEIDLASGTSIFRAVFRLGSDMFGLVSDGIIGQKAVSSRTFIPEVDNSINLGGSSYNWEHIYVNDIYHGSNWIMDFDGDYVDLHCKLEMSDNEITKIKYIDFNAKSSIAGVTKGAVYYDSDIDKLKVYNGSSWETISSS